MLTSAGRFGYLRLQDRTELEQEYMKFGLNLYAMVFSYEFCRGSDIDKVLNRFMDQMQLQAGWNSSVVAFVRQVLNLVLVKIGTGCRRWMRSYQRPEWSNLFKVGGAPTMTGGARGLMPVLGAPIVCHASPGHVGGGGLYLLPPHAAGRRGRQWAVHQRAAPRASAQL